MNITREPRSRDEPTMSKTNRPLRVLTKPLPNRHHHIQEERSDSFLRTTTTTVTAVPEQPKEPTQTYLSTQIRKGFKNQNRPKHSDAVEVVIPAKTLSHAGEDGGERNNPCLNGRQKEEDMQWCGGQTSKSLSK